MSPAIKLAAFGAALVLLFGGGALAGGAIDPDPGGSASTDPGREGGHGEGAPMAGMGEGAEGAHPVRGLGVAEGDLRIAVEDTELRRGRVELVRFRILEGGDTVTDFDLEHQRRMHMIVVRRDLTGFQHLHPHQLPDGSWSVPLLLREPGSYRLFADFSHRGEPYTLSTDLAVDGAADLRPLPAPKAVAAAGRGYRVRLQASGAEAGREAKLRFTITRGGEVVRTEPFLGAGGHLVALREGDLAFLHVHPTGEDHEGGAAEGGNGSLEFEATFPTAGRYRLFLQFKHGGRVHTAAFTQEVR